MIYNIKTEWNIRKRIGQTMEVFNHLDLEKKLDDINNDRHGIYEKK